MCWHVLAGSFCGRAAVAYRFETVFLTKCQRFVCGANTERVTLN